MSARSFFNRGLYAERIRQRIIENEMANGRISPVFVAAALDSSFSYVDLTVR